MAFTSLPIYLDPLNWNQPNQQTPNADQPSHMFISSNTNNESSQEARNNPNNSSNKPGSMTEQARLAKIPIPEPLLKCPRCDSTNTKFCYYNNYSLSQPRHFCKNCRRYWTRGGALRSVPVGGGCRRNKRGSKSSANKSGATSSAAVSSSSNCSSATSGSGLLPSNFSQNHHFPLLSNLYPLADQLGLNFSMMQQSVDANEYQLGGNIQQFPYQLGLDNSSVMSGINYSSFHGEVGRDDQLGFHTPMKISSATNLALITQMASVKMEDNHAQGMNLSRQYLGISGNDQYMSGAWDGNVSGFNSTSGNLL